ncbi:hypothetical protein J6590_069949 [Homalodisca vitripennis]|nr:hypothetical protein J6590_069949 [Homalodisca vitripennis]
MGKEEGMLPGTELNYRPRSPNKRVFVFHSPDVDVAHTEHDTGRQLSLTTAVYMSCTFITWRWRRDNFGRHQYSLYIKFTKKLKEECRVSASRKFHRGSTRRWWHEKMYKIWKSGKGNYE